ncbi:MAG: hypothetical protein EBR05_12200, partial [Marivivens sp.]|nr:hypothetical protein [Marivivens sp.]
GIRATNLWGDLEAAFLNTYQGRWQLSSDVVGNGYAQGKMLFWRRDILENAGGLIALGRDMAEDVASTKVVRKAGLKVRLLGNILPQPIGSRDWQSVWTRQVRWAKVRRMGFPALYAAEVLSGIAVPMLLTLFLTLNGTLNWASLLALPILWFGLEYLLARRAGWPAKPRDIATWIMRDAMIPALWVAGWRGQGFEWRGNSMKGSNGAVTRCPRTPWAQRPKAKNGPLDDPIACSSAWPLAACACDGSGRPDCDGDRGLYGVARVAEPLCGLCDLRAGRSGR